MLGGLTTLLLFLWFLWEWPQFIRGREDSSPPSNSDPLVAKIRMARIRAGLTPWPNDDDKENNR